MSYGPGGGCDIADSGDKKKKVCDGCFPSKAASPIVVKICRPLNRNPNRMNYGSRFPSNRGDCCKWCNNKVNANQMVFNQNQINNFDLINRINDMQPNGIPTNVTFTAGARPGTKKCDNCINILRDKELQLLKKEQEILKIKTHFTKLPKTGGQDGLGANCEQCFKALREKEFELFRKEQEIAKMKTAAAARSPLDTKAKIDRARCANCFKALRQKELELLKKEHALMKNMTRPNINVKNLNYCSCCRDNNKSSINKLKANEDLRKKNRDNCFKQLRMKEIQLLQKEREIDMKIQKFREESIAKAKKDLAETPDPRLVAPTTRDVIKCVCSCTGSAEQLKQQQQAKGICKYVYKKLPASLGGMRGVLPAIKERSSKSYDRLISPKMPPTCARPCCAMKLATNLAACFLRPPKCKKPNELPEPCKFMRMLSWCSPGNIDSKTIVKCCTIPTKPGKELSPKDEERLHKQIIKQKAEAAKAARVETKAASDYRVQTIGRITPGITKPHPTAQLDAYEAEILRESGPKGLKAYKTKMKNLRIDAEVTKAMTPQRLDSDVKYSDTKGPGKYTKKEAKELMARVTAQAQGPKSQDLYTGGGGQTGDLYTGGSDRVTGVPGAEIAGKKGTFKTKLYDRASKTARRFKVGSGPAPRDTTASVTPLGDYSDYSGPTVSQMQMPGGGLVRVPVKSKTADETIALSRKYQDKAEDETVAMLVKAEKEEKKEVVRKQKVEKAEKERREVVRKYKAKKADEEKKEVVRKFKAQKEEDRKEEARISKAKAEEEKYESKSAKYRRRDDYEEGLPKRYRSRGYKSKIYEDDEEYDGTRRQARGGFGSGDYEDSWKGGSRARSPPMTWYQSPPKCPNIVKIFGRTLIYCAGCFIGIPCILFLCLCFFMSSCSD